MKKDLLLLLSLMLITFIVIDAVAVGFGNSRSA